MGLGPNHLETLARARADLRMGVPVVIGDILAAAAETLNDARLQQMRIVGAEPVLAITGWRAQTLKARVYDGDIARLVMNDEPVEMIAALCNPALDLETPMKGPFQSLREGNADNHRLAIKLCKTARLLPAAFCVTLGDPIKFAGDHWLMYLDPETLKEDLSTSSEMHDVVAARLPMEVSENGRLHVFRPDDGGEEHYAVEIGRPNRNRPVLARLHSACLTGDVMGSLKCDCGPQLRGALEQMGAEGAGLLLYLNQEGRGIGLANKMRAYSLQDQGFDTVEANHRLGFEDDERDFLIGAHILKEMGFSSVRLLTNNPAKIAMMEASGIKVDERVPLKVGHSHHNHAYLATKARKSGHLL